MDIKCFEIVYVGDSIAKDVLSANQASIRSIHMAYIPADKKSKYEMLEKGIVPDFSILDLRQIPYILEVLKEDIKYIQFLS